MKTRRLVLIVVLALCGLCNVPSTTQAQGVNANFSLFYNELGHYGRWVNNPKYGQVWIYNEPGFRPYYSSGHWDYTTYGWSWVSDYSWGWAPFHYGRWEEDPYYGWIWIPGYEWGPAWVSWSQYDGYYGWAPLGYGVSFNVSFGSIPYNRWVFVPRAHITEYNVYNYYVQPRQRYVKNAVIINNYYNNGSSRYWSGPQRVEVERYVQRPIQTTSPQWGRPTEMTSRDQNRISSPQTNPDRVNFDRRDITPGMNNNAIENRPPVYRDGNRYFDRQQPVQTPAVRNDGIQNQATAPANRDWENRPGSRDHRITTNQLPQQNNPPVNADRGRVQNSRPMIPDFNRGNSERYAPRNFPTHSNPVMHGEGGRQNFDRSNNRKR